jgi:7-cyano-7-deazaguanine synthase in queuosine biosynthesis
MSDTGWEAFEAWFDNEFVIGIETPLNYPDANRIKKRFHSLLHAEYQRGRKEERIAIKDALPKTYKETFIWSNDGCGGCGECGQEIGWNAYRNEVVKKL